MDQDKKRELRQLKREIKRRGGKVRRRLLKEGLTASPEEAHQTVINFGRFESKKLNGLDRSQAWHETNAASSPGREANPDDSTVEDETQAPTNSPS